MSEKTDKTDKPVRPNGSKVDMGKVLAARTAQTMRPSVAVAGRSANSDDAPPMPQMPQDTHAPTALSYMDDDQYDSAPGHDNPIVAMYLDHFGRKALATRAKIDKARTARAELAELYQQAARAGVQMERLDALLAQHGIGNPKPATPAAQPAPTAEPVPPAQS